MFLLTPHERELFPHTLRRLSGRVLFAVLALVLLLMAANLIRPAQTAAATSSTINFQARLEQLNGAVAPDGNYFVEFNLYTAASGGSSVWTERYQGSAYSCPFGSSTGATNNKIAVVNGYLTANLGSLCSFPSSINWDQQLWLTMNIGGSGGSASWDGEMNPRLALTAVPYAFQAKSATQLQSLQGGITSTLSFATPSVGNQLFQIPDQAAAGTYNICVQGSSTCGFATGNGAAFIQGGNSFSAQAELGTNDNNNLAFRTNGADRLIVDTSGNAQFQQSTTLNVSTNATANAVGFNLTVQAGTANGSTTGNTGGILSLKGGNAAGTGDNNGGSINLDGGIATGVGHKGYVVLQSGGGNVGIGTNTPGAQLEVSASSATSVINIKSNGGSGRTFGLESTTTGTFVLRDITGTTDRITIDNAGATVINGTVQYTAGSTDSVTQVCRNSTGQLAGCSTTGAGVAFVQGGNSFGAAADLGTNDGNALNFRTNNATKLTLDTSGNLTFANGANRTLSIAQETGVNTGRTLTIAAGQGGSGNAAGGVLALQGGAGAGTNQNGGNVTIDGGAATGSGTRGNLILQGTSGNVAIGGSTATNLVTINSTGSVTPATASTYPLYINQGGGLGLGADANNAYIQSFSSKPLHINNAGSAIFLDQATTISGDLSFATGANRTISVGQESGTTTGRNLTIAAGQGGSTNAAGGVLALQGGAGAGAANNNGGNLTLDGGAATASGTKGYVILQGTSGNVGIGTTSPSALLSVGTGSAFQVNSSGNVTFVASGTSGTTQLCQNGSGQLAGCTNNFETTTGTDFIRNQNTVQTSANFYIRSAAIGSVAGVIEGANGQTADLLDLNTFNGTTSSIVASFSAAGNLSFGSGANKTIAINQAASGNNGDQLTIQAGSGNGTNKNGGTLLLQGGAATGSGTGGGVLVKSQTDSTTAFQIQNASGVQMVNFDTTTGKLTLGRISPSGTAVQGKIVFGDGTLGNFSATLQVATQTADTVFQLPGSLATGTYTLCTTSTCMTGTASNFIQNSTTVQTSANFYTRSAAIGSVGGVIEGASGQTADLLDLNSYNGTSSTTVARFTASGALRLSGTGTDTFTTPVGSSVATKINIPLYDPGAFGQILAFGLNSSANSSARAISIFDQRAAGHQPSVAVFTPDENNVGGFSWDGSNTNLDINTTGGAGGISSVSLTPGSQHALTAYGTGDVSISEQAGLQADTGYLVTIQGRTLSVASSGNGANAKRVLSVGGGDGQGVSAITGVTAGNGGDMLLVGGNGGAASGASGANVGGNGGGIVLQAGNGGNVTSGSGTSGSGASITLSAGKAGTGGTAGSDGSVIIKNQSNTAAAFQVQNAGGVQVATVDTLNSQLILGRIAASGTVPQGKLVFGDGTTDNFSATLQVAVQTASTTFQLPGSLVAGTYTLCTTVTCATGNGVAFLQGGNSFGADANLGTNDGNNLNFRTNSTTRLTLDTSGNLNFAGSNTISTTATNGTIALQSNGTGAVTVDSGTTGNVNIGTGGSNKTINIGATGSTNAASTVHIGDTSANQAQVVSIGNSANSSSTVTIQGGAMKQTISNSGVTIQSTTNSSTAFQVQGNTGAPVFSVDTTSTAADGATLNYVSYSGFETGSFSNASTGWNAVSPGSLSQNTTKSNSFNGVASAQLTTTTSNGGITTSSFVGSPSSGTYLVSFYAKVSSGTMASSAFTVTSTDGTTHTCSPAAGITINSSGFQRLFCSFTASGGVTALQIAQNDSTARTIYIDAVQMQSTTFNSATISAPTPYQVGAVEIRGTVTSPVAIINNADSTTAFLIQNATATSSLFVADTLNTRIGIGVGSPSYELDVRGSTSSQLHLSDGSTDIGGYILGRSNNELSLSGGFAWNGSTWVAKSTSGSILSVVNGGFTFYGNTGLTVGNTYSPSQLLTISNAGAVTVSNSLTVSGLNTAGIVTNTSAGLLGTVATLPVGNGGTGLNSYTAGDLLVATAGTTIGKITAVAANQCLLSNGVGNVPVYGNCFIQGGNSFGGAANLGTNDANSLNLRTGSNTRLTIDNSGNLSFASGSGSFTQAASTGTFDTGSGTVSLNGNTAVTGTKTFTVNGGLATLQAGLTANGGAISLQGNTTSSFTTTAGDLTIDATSASTPNVNIGTGAQNKAVTIGNTQSSTTLTVKSGAVTTTFGNAGVTLQTATNSATALVVQNTGGTNVLTADTSNGRLVVGPLYSGNVNLTAQLQVTGSIPTSALSTLTIGGANTQTPGIFVSGRYLYEVNENSNTLRIFDISKPTAMVQLVSYSLSGLGGVAPIAVYVQGHYAYIADYSGNQLEIVDVSNPKSPSNGGSVSTGASTNPGNVYVSGRYAYVSQFTGGKVSVVDVSNPTHPVVASTSASIGGSAGLGSIYGQGRYVYVMGNGIVAALDASNPASITTAGTYTTSISASVTQRLTAQGHYLYVPNATNHNVVVLDISNPTTMTLAATITTSGTGNVEGAFVQGRYLYVAVANTSNVLQVFDVSNLSAVTSIGTTSLASATSQDLFVSGRYAYVVGDNATGVQAFDVGGGYIQQLETGGIETNTLQTNGNEQIGGDSNIQGSLGVGQNLEVNGNLGVSGQVVFQNATNSTTAFQVQNASGASVLVVDTTNRQLKVMENGGSTNYALVYYDTATSTANYTASGGTVAVGTGSGAISVVAGSSSAITITANAASTWKTTAGTLTLQSGTSSDLILNSGSSIVSLNGSNVLKLGASAGDPGTCTVGAIVYNSTTNQFRGCQGSTPAWVSLGATSSIQAAYTAASGGTVPEIKLDSTRGGLDIQDADTTINGILFGVRGSNAGGLGTSLFNVNSSNSTVNVGTSDTSGTLLVLDTDTDSTFNGGTATNAATAINGAMFYSSTDHNFMCGTASQWITCNGLLYSNTAASTAVTTCTNACAAFSTNNSTTVPANYCTAGRVIRIAARGHYSVAAATTPTLQMGVYYGTNSTTRGSDTQVGASTPAPASASGASNQFWSLDYTITCFDTTHMMGEGTYTFQNNATTTTSMLVLNVLSTASTAVTTTSANALYIFPTWSASSASNTVTCDQLVITGN